MGLVFSCNKKHLLIKTYPYSNETSICEVQDEVIITDNQCNFNVMRSIKYNIQKLEKIITDSNFNKFVNYIDTGDNNSYYDNPTDVMYYYRYSKYTFECLRWNKNSSVYFNLMGIVLACHVKEDFRINAIKHMISVNPHIKRQSCLAFINPKNLKVIPSVYYNGMYRTYMPPVIFAIHLGLSIEIIQELIIDDVYVMFTTVNAIVKFYTIAKEINNHNEMAILMPVIATCLSYIKNYNFELITLKYNSFNLNFDKFHNYMKESLNDYDYISVIEYMYDISEKINNFRLGKIAQDITATSLKSTISIEDLKNADCVVCLSDNHYCKLGITNCGHYICSDCYSDVLEKFNKCPICLYELTSEVNDMTYM
jgi:hypothetical protein